MADNPDSGTKSLEMRVAELEDKLSKLHITEDELKAYQKVSALVGGGAGAAANPAAGCVVDCVGGCINECAIRACTIARYCTVLRQCTIIRQCCIDVGFGMGGGLTGGGFSGGGFGSLGG